MSKLIGTSPNQVPSNADLGTAAFMDAKDLLTSRGSSLSAVNAVIPKTATSVFVYDTSKDSDGGAWRKRVNHTSWYNEPLNTTTRGSRREFPSVAVIISENKKVTIYDGDDPNLPMWMVFTAGEMISEGPMFTFWGISTTGNVSTISALNGIVSIGVNNGSSSGTYVGICGANFVSDDGFMLRVFASQNLKYTRPISQRNVNDYTLFATLTSNGLAGGNVNSVAMTVLPNAPIDAATDLPVPTIVVATDVGMSIIRDNGNVVDSSDTNVYSNIDISQDYRIISGRSGTTRFFISDRLDNITSDGWDPYEFAYALDTAGYPRVLSNDYSDNFCRGKDSYVRGGSRALTLWNVNSSDVSSADDFETNSLAAYISSTYNTGWTHGNTKLVTLSDTDATDIDGNEFVTNGTFDTDLSGWTLDGGGAVQNNGKMEMTNTAQYGSSPYQTLSGLIPGQKYVLTLDVATVSGDGSWYIDNAFGSSVQPTTSAQGTFSYDITATGTTGTIQIKKRYVGTISVDNVSVRIAENDRSRNNKCLQVFGNITKTPVANGAELVSYGNFASTRYIYQPYDAELSPGNADVCFMHWHKGDTNKIMIWTSLRRPLPDAGGWIQFWTGTSSGTQLQFGVNSGTGSDNRVGVNSTAFHDGQWHHYVGLRRNGVYEIYVDGKLQGSTNHGSNNTLTTDTHKFLIGNHFDFNSAYSVTGDMALVKYSLTAPSAEQIYKIYQEEKMLFQDNAKCTLYGTSDAVTALAYDNKTEILHVGTSNGRSDFQGLRRVNNTTRAVSTAISAVDGFIVEE